MPVTRPRGAPTRDLGEDRGLPRRRRSRRHAAGLDDGTEQAVSEGNRTMAESSSSAATAPGRGPMSPAPGPLVVSATTRATSRRRPASTPAAPSTSPARTSGTTSTTAWARAPTCPAEPERFDFDALPRASSPSAATTSSGCGAGSSSGRRPPVATTTCDMTPQPWARTGPGTAKDGKPRFDLEQFDDGVLRPAARAGRRRPARPGIYVGVMLFDGWALHLSPPPDHIEGHPFHAGNNVNGVAADVDRRPPGAAARPAGRRRSRRRTSGRSSTPCTTCRTCSGRWPTSRPATGR